MGDNQGSYQDSAPDKDLGALGIYPPFFVEMGIGILIG